MKRMLLVLVLTLGLAGMAFANNDATNSFSPNAIANTGNNNTIYGAGSGSIGVSNSNSNTFNPTNINTNVGINTNENRIDNRVTNTNTNTNTNVNTNLNTNVQSQGQDQKQKQGQIQSQGQGQEQGQKQFGFVNIETPQNLLSSPAQEVPPLHFGNGRMMDATRNLPNFSLYGIVPLGKEPIREVLSVNANVKFKNLYKEILSGAKKVADGQSTADIRYQVVLAQAQKTWAIGGNGGGAGSGLASSGFGGASGALSIIPQVGGTKADDLFTIIFVRVN